MTASLTYRKLATALGIAVTVVAAMLLLVGSLNAPTTSASPLSRSVTNPNIRPTGPIPVTPVAPVSTALAPGTAPATATPQRISIPSIGVSAGMQLLTRDASGQLVPPNNTVQAGWYTDSPLPGDTGPAVIGGHVDSYAGPGVFFELRDLQPGDQIMVGEGKVGVLTFVVQRVEEYPKTAFPISAVFGPVPGAQLRVVTCGGEFDSQTKHYLSNIVVYATYVSTANGPRS